MINIFASYDLSSYLFKVLPYENQMWLMEFSDYCLYQFNNAAYLESSKYVSF